MKKGERGLTLIEVIATAAILSIISIVIWSVFLQGYKYSQKSVSKNFLLQESNILITNLKNLHRSINKYEITTDNCSIKVTNLDTSKVQVFDNTNICFNIVQINGINGSGPKTVEPKKNGNDLSLKISASDKKNPENIVTIDTYLYRLKGADYQ